MHQRSQARVPFKKRDLTKTFNEQIRRRRIMPQQRNPTKKAITINAYQSFQKQFQLFHIQNIPTNLKVFNPTKDHKFHNIAEATKKEVRPCMETQRHLEFQQIILLFPTQHRRPLATAQPAHRENTCRAEYYKHTQWTHAENSFINISNYHAIFKCPSGF